MGRTIASTLMIGCGYWPRTALTLSERGIAVTAMDKSKDVIEKNRLDLGSSGIEFIEADAEKYRPQKSFDLALIAGTIGLSGEERRVVAENLIASGNVSLVCIRQPVREELVFFPETPKPKGAISVDLHLEHPENYLARTFLFGGARDSDANEFPFLQN